MKRDRGLLRFMPARERGLASLACFMPPFGLVIPPSGGVWDACAACDFAQASRSEFFLLPFGLVIPPSGGVWDACAACDFASPAWGRGGLLGAAPLLGPLCTPPGTPPKKRFQFPSGNEGNASPAAGASFPRFARSGDLPPRRVYARVRFRFDQ